jgi:hypothetical protein
MASHEYVEPENDSTVNISLVIVWKQFASNLHISKIRFPMLLLCSIFGICSNIPVLFSEQ